MKLRRNQLVVRGRIRATRTSSVLHDEYALESVAVSYATSNVACIVR